MKRQRYVLIMLTLITSCRVSEFYTIKELRQQKVPTALQGKTWTLKGINGDREPATSIAAGFQNNNADCIFVFQFSDKGELLMNFKGHHFKGTYLIEGNRFKYLSCGWNEKIVWTSNPECNVTPTQLAYILYGEFKFEIAGNTLVLDNTTGTRFELSAKEQKEL